ncbi:ABC transporter ATP-binding protein [Pseudonocardia kunmingensis]|uniref:ATP-binding cassette subfamily B protein n=1 Tax=Pseudonocardia kunmingensis TaxID=630975 RepID=A0A543DWC6_9PSEU|nr:ABC transporter ATP-binding protein [Pseudonocardia kunmingensis]TQM13615.1 ATP-binding cassette subfamily B protein [Pseudonocardia kunmingensis]
MIRDLLRLLGPEHRSRLYAYFAWVAAYGVLQGIATVLLVPVFEALLAGDTAAAVRGIGAVAVAVLLTCVAHYVQAMRGFAVAIIVLTTMHERMGDHVATLPLGWFTGEKIGRLSRTATSGTMMVAGLFAHLLTPTVVGAVTPATIAVAMLAYDWRLGLAVLVCTPLLFLAFRAGARLVGRGDELDDAAAVAAGNRVVEFARTQRVLRAFGRGVDGYAPLDAALEHQRRAGRRSLWYAVLGMVLGGVSVQVVFTALLVVGVLLAVSGQLAVGTAIALIALAARFTGPLAEVGDYAGTLRMARNDLRRLTSILDERALPEAADPAPLPEPGAVELDGVSFGYETGRPVLRDVDLRIPPRTMTALVGSSGSGKTTVTRLIARFWDTDAGVVRVGGADVRDQPTEQLMDQLALVFQDVYLFDDTLEANIRVGRPGASEAEVRAAARLAGVEEIVDRLPRGWDTRVGEGGTSLSGGERQRVSVARALVKNAPIVLLDEATAALDPENERYLTDALRALAERSTLLVIAHRLPTVVAADRIVVLDGGGVAEQGTHAELLAAGGRYARFWDSRTRARGWRLTGADAVRR